MVETILNDMPPDELDDWGIWFQLKYEAEKKAVAEAKREKNK